MITDDQIIDLARETLHGAKYTGCPDIVALVTRTELIKFTREAIDATTHQLRVELLALQNADKLLAEAVIEREQLRQALLQARHVLMQQNALIERIERLNPDAGEIGAGMLASLVEDAKRVFSLPTPE